MDKIENLVHKIAAIRNATGEIKFEPISEQKYSDYLSKFSILLNDLDELKKVKAISDFTVVPRVSDFPVNFFYGENGKSCEDLRISNSDFEHDNVEEIIESFNKMVESILGSFK
ncbi:hypothetical protein MHBO_003104 [Bonamia ostreae]|uniref:Uncharacterized protein n=1 Tax=Bonamia ostreae TaxID=126728 RepID=A0ABV2APG9_9EUKA